MDVALTAKDTLRDSGIEAFRALFDGEAEFRVLTGAKPATCETAESGTLLGSIPLADPFFAVSVEGLLEGACPFSDLDMNAGTAGYWRIDAAGGGCLAQGTVATSGADLNLSSVLFAASDTLTVTQFDFNVTVT